MLEEVHRRKDLLKMYTVVFTDDNRFAESNEQIVLTCCEYLVMDLRSDSERARVPADVKFQEFHEEVMDRLDDDIRDLMRWGKREQLQRALKIMAPNRYTEVIKHWLKTGRVIGVQNEREPTTKKIKIQFE